MHDLFEGGCRPHGIPGVDRSSVHTVDTNISLGTSHLRQLLDGLENHPVLASAAYNAGMSRARDWRADRTLEGAVYAETIPFSETRAYVMIVLANREEYRRLYGLARGMSAPPPAVQGPRP